MGFVCVFNSASFTSFYCIKYIYTYMGYHFSLELEFIKFMRENLLDQKWPRSPLVIASGQMVIEVFTACVHYLVCVSMG